MKYPPELALTIAMIALVGVLVNALVAAYNARKRSGLDERLLNIQTEHAEKLKNLEFKYAKDLSDDERKRKTDLETFTSILELLDPQGVIIFLKEHDFGGSFKNEDIVPLNSFINYSSGADQGFLFADLEQMRIQVVKQARILSKLIGIKTHPRKKGFNSVLSEAYVNEPRPEHVNQSAEEINSAATEFISLFDRFVKECRMKLGS